MNSFFKKKVFLHIKTQLYCCFSNAALAWASSSSSQWSCISSCQSLRCSSSSSAHNCHSSSSSLARCSSLAAACFSMHSKNSVISITGSLEGPTVLTFTVTFFLFYHTEAVSLVSDTALFLEKSSENTFFFCPATVIIPSIVTSSSTSTFAANTLSFSIYI